MSTPALRANGVKFGANDVTAYVTAYDATGNGSTDDTTAIQAAITAAPSGSTLVFPSGVYNISTALTMSTANVRVIGYGAKIVQTGTLQRGFNISGANCSLEGLWIYNNRGGSDWINGTPTNAIGVSVSGAADVKIINCKIENWGYTAIQTGTSPGLQIAGNRIIGIGSGGGLVTGSNTNIGIAADVSGIGGEGIRVTNNRFSDLAQGFFSGQDWTDIQLVGNEFMNIIGQHAIYIDDALNVAITGNAINTTGRVGINVQVASNATRDGGNISIIGNTIRNTTLDGIALVAGSGGLTFYHKGVVIADNVIQSAGQNGIQVDQLDNYLIANNVITTATNYGIYANTNSRNGRITGNTISASGFAGMYLAPQSSSYTVVVEDNLWNGCNTASSGTSLQNSQLYVTTAKFIVRNNIVQSPGAGAVWNFNADATSSYILQNNIWSGSLTYTLSGTLLATGYDAASAQSSMTNYAAITQSTTAIGVAITAGETLTNPTAATVGAQQNSPALVLQGNGWQTNTPASEAVAAKLYVVPVQSTPHPVATVNLTTSINGAADVTQVQYNSAGDLTLPAGNARILCGNVDRVGGTGTLSVGLSATQINVGQSGCPVNLGDGTVTQITSITTGVTLNKSTGVITTVSAATAAQATSAFVVTNSNVLAGSVVNVSLGAYSGTFGTNGSPIVTFSAVGAGSFTVLIYNAHAANALAGTLKISYSVL